MSVRRAFETSRQEKFNYDHDELDDPASKSSAGKFFFFNTSPGNAACEKSLRSSRSRGKSRGGLTAESNTPFAAFRHSHRNNPFKPDCGECPSHPRFKPLACAAASINSVEYANRVSMPGSANCVTARRLQQLLTRRS